MWRNNLCTKSKRSAMEWKTLNIRLEHIFTHGINPKSVTKESRDNIHSREQVFESIMLYQLGVHNNLLDKGSYKGDREGGSGGESLQQQLETVQLTKPVHQVNQPTLKPHLNELLFINHSDVYQYISSSCYFSLKSYKHIQFWFYQYVHTHNNKVLFSMQSE